MLPPLPWQGICLHPPWHFLILIKCPPLLLGLYMKMGTHSHLHIMVPLIPNHMGLFHHQYLQAATLAYQELTVSHPLFSLTMVRNMSRPDMAHLLFRVYTGPAHMRLMAPTQDTHNTNTNTKDTPIFPLSPKLFSTLSHSRRLATETPTSSTGVRA